MSVVTFFTRPECTLCVSALYVIKRVRVDAPFELEIVDISATENEDWCEAYRNDIPVVHLNGKEIFRYRVDERRLREILQP
jgi:glutaredoxin